MIDRLVGEARPFLDQYGNWISPGPVEHSNVTTCASKISWICRRPGRTSLACQAARPSLVDVVDQRELHSAAGSHHQSVRRAPTRMPGYESGDLSAPCGVRLPVALDDDRADRPASDRSGTPQSTERTPIGSNSWPELAPSDRP